MKGHLRLALGSSFFLLAPLLLGTVVGLTLPGQTKEVKDDGHWMNSGRRIGPSIPIWTFLQRGSSSDSHNSLTHSDLVRKSKRVGEEGTATSFASDKISDSDEILRADDLTSVLSSKARLLNSSKRSPSYSISGELSRKTDDVKRNRPYDVPLIECPLADDGMERFSCPTPDAVGRYRCVDDHVLCDGFIDCPNAEDEDRQACMFYKTTKAHLDVLADALLRWARGR